MHVLKIQRRTKAVGFSSPNKEEEEEEDVLIHGSSIFE